MRNPYRVLISIAALLLSISLAQADVPTSLRGEHAGQMTVSGKITLFRVQIKSLQFGPANDRLDVQILVTLDSQPDMVFGVPQDEPAAGEMITTLREAYLHGMSVTIEAPKEPGRKNLRIIVVQLGK